MNNGLKLQRKFGETVTIRGASGEKIALTPEAQALTIRWPWGGFVWNRPSAISVERDGSIQRIPIVDLTRVIQLSLVGFSLVMGVFTILFSLRKRRVSNEG